jgi:hypothetical protein
MSQSNANKNITKDFCNPCNIKKQEKNQPMNKKTKHEKQMSFRFSHKIEAHAESLVSQAINFQVQNLPRSVFPLMNKNMYFLPFFIELHQLSKI